MKVPEFLIICNIFCYYLLIIINKLIRFQKHPNCINKYHRKRQDQAKGILAIISKLIRFQKHPNCINKYHRKRQDQAKGILAIISKLIRFQKHPNCINKYHRKRQDQAKRVINRLATFTVSQQKLSYLKKINVFTFEELLLEAFERRGYTVLRNTQYTKDGGIDGKVIIGGVIWFVQAKRYQNYIPTNHIIEFLQLLNKHHCQGFFCHTGMIHESIKTMIQQEARMIMISDQQLLDFLNISIPFYPMFKIRIGYTE